MPRTMKKATAHKKKTRAPSEEKPTTTRAEAPASQSVEQFAIRDVVYEVLEELGNDVVKLRYTFPAKKRDGTHEVNDFYYNKATEKRVIPNSDGQYNAARGRIVGQRMGPRKAAGTGKPAAKGKSVPAQPRGGSITLSPKAQAILDEFIRLDGSSSPEEVLSRLINNHLAEEIKRLKLGQEALRRLPSKLLGKLVHASPEQLQKAEAALG